MKAFLRSIVRPIVRLFARIFVVPVCRFIERVWQLRLTPMLTARIGYLAVNNYLYVAQKHLGQEEACSGRLFFGANR